MIGSSNCLVFYYLKKLVPLKTLVCTLVLRFFFSSGIEGIVIRKQSVSYMFEVVVFERVCINVDFVNKIFIISENAVFQCVLK